MPKGFRYESAKHDVAGCVRASSATIIGSVRSALKYGS
jgi:hypothetical protein